MGRPKKSATGEMATVKLENAFWSLLETERYSDITVLRITQEAGTNRNSFYYHYQDIDDLALRAFQNNIDNEVSRALVSALMSAFQEDRPTPVFDLSVLPYSKRIMLCARSDSPYLRKLVSDLLMATWFEFLSIEEGLLTEEEKLQVKFIAAGLVSVLGSEEVRDNPLAMSALSQTETGRAIIRIMKNIAARQQ